MCPTKPIEEIQGFNQLNRDAWVAEHARRLPAGVRLLDVGAGTCPYRDLFGHLRYEAHDFAKYKGYRDEQLNEGVYGRLDYVSDATAIPVPDESFDAVLCTEVLEHVNGSARLGPASRAQLSAICSVCSFPAS